MPGTTDTVKTILTPGEFVIRKEAVDMIGVPMLNMINNMPEKGGHSNIDRLIEMATTENMKGMYGGGMVKAGPKPMGHGGMVDAYRGGGMVMDQYGHGGMVKNKMMSYGHGGMVKDKMMMMEKGGQLKPVPEDNPGLGKLPEMVRNRMGYMQGGGMVDDSLMGMRYGGMAKKKKKMMGYQEGGPVEEGIPLPPQPRDPLQIGARQADPSMYEGSQLGVRDQAMMLQDSIEQDTVNKARKTLQLMKLKGLLEGAESLDYQEPEMKQGADEEMTRQMLQRMIMMRGMPF